MCAGLSKQQADEGEWLEEIRVLFIKSPEILLDP